MIGKERQRFDGRINESYFLGVVSIEHLGRAPTRRPDLNDQLILVLRVAYNQYMTKASM